MILGRMHGPIHRIVHGRYKRLPVGQVQVIIRLAVRARGGKDHGERLRPEQHRRPHDFLIQEWAHANGVACDEIAAEKLRQIAAVQGAFAGLGAKTGVYAIVGPGRLAAAARLFDAFDGPLDPGRGLLDPRAPPRFRGQCPRILQSSRRDSGGAAGNRLLSGQGRCRYSGCSP